MHRTKNTPRQPKHTDRTSNTPHSIFTSSLKGYATGLLLSFVLALIFSGISLSANDPDRLILPLSLVSVYLSSFTAGFVSQRIHRENKLICGTVSGILFATTYMLISLFFSNDGYQSLGFVPSSLLRLACIASSVLGAFSFSGSKRKRKRS